MSLYFSIIRNINMEVMQLFEEPQSAVWPRSDTDISCLQSKSITITPPRPGGGGGH
jgi:hypothetical protein